MPSLLSRRMFLAGAGAAAVAACSGKSSPAAPTSTSQSAVPERVLVSFSDASALVPGSPQRVTFGVADKDGVIISGPKQLDFGISFSGKQIGPTVRTDAHSDGLPRPYYPVVFTPSQPGIYTVNANVDGVLVDADVQIPANTDVVSPGQAMPQLDTPTVADPRGVELLCTRKPACDLHDISLREALTLGTPVAFLVATPQFCQTAICGPVLDVLLAQKANFPQIKMLHAEVYPSEADAQAGQQKLTDAVNALRLTFEPALYLVNAGGTIVKRLDTIFDGVELHDALAQLAG